MPAGLRVENLRDACHALWWETIFKRRRGQRSPCARHLDTKWFAATCTAGLRRCAWAGGRCRDGGGAVGWS